MNITDITSAKVPVFTCDTDIDRNRGYHFQNVIEIDGIDADETMSQINGRQFFIYPGSAGLVIGTSKISSTFLAPTSTTGATITGNTSGLELVPKFSPTGAGRGATITASCTATALTIVSIDAAGSNYTTGIHTVTLGGKTWDITINSNPDGVILNTKNHSAERRKFRVSTVYNKRRQPSVHLNQFSISVAEVDTFDTSGFDAISSSSDCTLTQVNPVSFELVISGTFDSETSTIPASYITAVGTLDLGDAYGENQYMEISGGSLTSSQLIEEYSLYEGAKIRQTDGSSNRVFMGTILSIVSITSTKVRVIFLVDSDGNRGGAQEAEPAINGGSKDDMRSHTYPSTVSVGTGSAGILTFTGVTPTAAVYTTGNTLGTWDFKINNDGTVYDIAPNNPGAYKEGTYLIFAQGDLNSANSSYVTTRGQITLVVDVNGTPSASLDGALTFSGTAEQVVDAAYQVLGQGSVTLSGSIPTKSTADYTARLQAKLERGAGFQITQHANLGTGNQILLTGFNTPRQNDPNYVQVDHGLGNGEQCIFNAPHGKSPLTHVYVANEDSSSDYTVYLYKQYTYATDYPGTIFTAYDDTDDTGVYPHSDGYSRGMHGTLYAARAATQIKRITLDGEIKP